MSITILVNRDTVDYFTEQLNTTIHSITPFDWTKETPNFKGENNDVLVTFAKGKVVSLREANGYHDSDFYATFLNDNGEFVDYCYASTRGWTYANGATIDATPETMEAYAAHITAPNAPVDAAAAQPAEVGPGWTLRFAGSTPIAELCRKHPELCRCAPHWKPRSGRI